MLLHVANACLFCLKHCICLKTLHLSQSASVSNFAFASVSCPSSAAGDLPLTTTMACVKCSTHLSTMMPSTSWRGRSNQVALRSKSKCVKLLCEVGLIWHEASGRRLWTWQLQMFMDARDQRGHHASGALLLSNWYLSFVAMPWILTYALVGQVMNHPAFVDLLMTILSRPGRVIRTTVRCVHLI